MRKSNLLIMFFLLGSSLVFSLDFSVDSKELHLYILGLKKAEAPHIYDGNLVISYQGHGTEKRVGIALSTEGFKQIHTMAKNPNNIFVYVIKPPRDVDTITYRFVIDGIWMPDPANPNTIRDREGIILSLAKIPLQSLPEISPEIDGNTVIFTYRTEPGKKVTLVGEFCNWDPFLLVMQEVSPGVYQRKLRLPAGSYAYYFFVNGKRVADPLNPKNVYLDNIKISIVNVNTGMASYTH
ncbi:hypothetical protein WKV44_02235 [Spirochaetia bacterium 38H-sp]|uniref:AMP-activated protein kinase glycogen-binding domain-containing protein n=1 Tax=Rarispira pelagica TaxID=3141764 RepID=A0ABU9U9K3_9SPIR